MRETVITASQPPDVFLKTGQTARNDPFSALMVAKETLRLYPPTRCIYRKILSKPNGVPCSELFAADIETMQREIYGCSDGSEFKPCRWRDIERLGAAKSNKWLLAFGFRLQAS